MTVTLNFVRWVCSEVVDRDRLPEPDQLPIENVDLPLENVDIDASDGRVSAYPDRVFTDRSGTP